MSTRQIAEAVEIGTATVAKIIKDTGVAVAPALRSDAHEDRQRHRAWATTA